MKSQIAGPAEDKVRERDRQRRKKLPDTERKDWGPPGTCQETSVKTENGPGLLSTGGPGTW